MELIIIIGLHEPKYCNIYGKNLIVGLADIRAKALMKKIMILQNSLYRCRLHMQHQL